MNFRIVQHTDPLDVTEQREYEKGLRNPYWFATFVIHTDNPSTPYIPARLLENHPFYEWCTSLDIRVEVVHQWNATYLYAYIQHSKHAVEAKMRFG